MDDLQFNASIDALLAHDTALDESTTQNGSSASTSPFPSTMMNNAGAGSGNNLYSSTPNTMLLGQAFMGTPVQQYQQQPSSHNQFSNPTAYEMSGSSGQSGCSSHPGDAGGNSVAYPQTTQYHQQQQCQSQSQNDMSSSHHHQHHHHSGTASVSSRGSFNSHGSVASSNKRSKEKRTSNRRASASSSSHLAGSKRSRGHNNTSMAVSEDEDDRDRRRQDRNLREQQRSSKITQQIEHLREILSAANIRFKPDKYSTLVTVADYIKQLQERSTMLDAEHTKLIGTICKTNEWVNESHLPRSATTSAASNSNNNGSGSSSSDTSRNAAGGGDASSTGVSGIYNEDELVFVRNVDYKSVFLRCGVPLAVASIDGRFLDCNVEFENVTGYRREELLPRELITVSISPSSMDAMSSLSDSQAVSSSCVSSAEDVARPINVGSTPSIADVIGKSSESGGQKQDNVTSSKQNNVKTKDVDGKKNNDEHIRGLRNLSLFNILSRDCMEEVFFSLSNILKQPTSEQEKKGDSIAQQKDYWTGHVRLGRNCSQEMRINVVLVRSPEGRAKFFNCYLTPLTGSG